MCPSKPCAAAVHSGGEGLISTFSRVPVQTADKHFSVDSIVQSSSVAPYRESGQGRENGLAFHHPRGVRRGIIAKQCEKRNEVDDEDDEDDDENDDDDGDDNDGDEDDDDSDKSIR